MGIAGPTDVMTFAMETPIIVISLDTAARQARARRVTLQEEVTLLVLHGLLHLAGFDDRTVSDWKAMKQAEFKLLYEALA